MPELPEVSTRTPDQTPETKMLCNSESHRNRPNFDLWLLLQSILCYKHRKSQHFWFRISNVWMSFFRLVWNDIFLSWSFLKNSLNPLTECWHRKINTYFDYLWIAYIANLKKKRFGVRCYSETESFNRNQRPGLIWKTIWFEALSFRRTIKSFSRWSS